MVRLQQNMGLPSFMHIFAGNVSLHSSCLCSCSVILFGHIKAYFLKNKVILSSFLGHKKLSYS